MTSWISCSGPTGTCRLPRSTRSCAGKASPASHGPPSAREVPAGCALLGQLIVERPAVIELVAGQLLITVPGPIPARVC